MSMDVYGKAPKSEVGGYFRNNVWEWRPLADYCRKVAPEICAPCQYWHSNDGDGLAAAGAEALAEALQKQIDSKAALCYEKLHNGENESAPDVPCDLCEGTGIRRDALAQTFGHLEARDGGKVCNSCQGKGSKRPWSTNYPFSVENVQKFVNFLRDCGGFEIN